MKQTKKFGIFILIVSLLACNKTKTEHVKNNDEEIIRVFSKMGEYHNKGLDYLFNRLNHTKSSRSAFARTSIAQEVYVEEVNAIVDDYFVTTFSLPSDDVLPYFRDSVVVNPECTNPEFVQYLTDSAAFVPSSSLTNAINSIFATIEGGYVAQDTSSSQFDVI